MITTEEILFPAYKVSSTSWSDDDATHILRTTSGTPSCISTGLEWIEDEGDDDRISFRLDPVDSYSFGFNEFEIHIFICATDSFQETQVQLKIGSETFTLNCSSSTGAAQWFTDSFESSTTYNSGQVNFATLEITADGGNHRDCKIPTVYVIAKGFYDVEQWAPDGAVVVGGCSGFKVHKSFGGVVVGGTNQLENGIHFKASGGVVVGKTTKYGKGGVLVGGTAYIRTGPQGNGGIVVSGTNQLEVKMRTRGGVIVGSPSFPNGFFWRVPVSVPGADENMLGVLIGVPVYVPFQMAQYRIEDSEGNEIAYEIVSSSGLRMSVFFKINVRTEEQTVYLYGKGRAEE
jgi:hypothetical protein